MSQATIYVYLAVAIVAEVLATTALAASQSFTRLGPSLAAALGYAAAFWFLSVPLRFLPAGIVYAVWSGLGIVLIAASGWLFFGQRLDTPGVLGIGLILAGVIILNAFSTAGH